MKMTKPILLLLITLQVSTILSGQNNFDSENINEEEIYIKLLDTLISNFKFEFYEESLNHVDTKEIALNPFDTIKFTDSETYEEIAKHGIDYKIEKDSLNFEEAKLFRQRIKYPNGIYLIGKIQSDQVHKNVDYKKYIHIENYPDVVSIKEFNDQILVNNKLGKYDAFPLNKEHLTKFKYAVKSIITFSAIQWNRDKSYCVVEIGYHYRYGRMGYSGGGFQAILKKDHQQIRILKFIGLWEE